MQIVAAAIGSYFVAQAMLAVGALLTTAGSVASTIGWFIALSVASLRSAASSAAAWVSASLPVIALTAAVLLAYLAFDDLTAFLEGRDSLIGDWGQKLENRLQKWSTSWSSGDFPLIGGLKLVVWYLEDITRLVDAVQRAWNTGENPIMAVFRNYVDHTDQGIKEQQLRAAFESPVTTGPGFAPPSYFGEGAGTAAASAPKQFNIEQHIHVETPPDADTRTIVEKVKDATKDQWGKIARDIGEGGSAVAE